MRQWMNHDDIRMVAVCDVRAEYRQQAKEAVDARYGDKSCAAYSDFRELLARPDIDAVNIAPGERWHALMAIEAARHGKHMYCQKPMALTIEEAKAVRSAIQHYRFPTTWAPSSVPRSFSGTPPSWFAMENRAAFKRLPSARPGAAARRCR